MVTEADGTLRYIGRHLRGNALHGRWLRHGVVHHQEGSRNRYIGHLDRGAGPLTVWSANTLELRPYVRLEGSPSEEKIACGLEALWVARWRTQLWNVTKPRRVPGVLDVLSGT